LSEGDYSRVLSFWQMGFWKIQKTQGIECEGFFKSGSGFR
jgi:hypothetical protein